MLKANEEFQIGNDSIIEWMINEEPTLVKKIVEHFLDEDLEISFDGRENARRLSLVSDYIRENIRIIYDSLDDEERLVLYVMNQSFGWLVYESIDSAIGIMSYVFKRDPQKLRHAINTLMGKFLVYKLERLKRYNLLFSPPIFLKGIAEMLGEEGFLETSEDAEDIRESLSPYQYIGLIAGLISYVITYSPRSSETNEIHKIDFTKMVDFFSDFAHEQRVDKIIKKLSKFGFFEKLNNRIVVNKNILDKILELSINEQLFIIFLYEFMDKFDFKKSYFMTLKILANQNRAMPLRELFFYYLNNEIYLRLKNEIKNIKSFIQQEELKFTFFVKTLEAEDIAVIGREDPDKISLATDSIVMNEPHCSLLNNISFEDKFVGDQFIVEPNYEIIVEPYIKPDVLFKLALMTEPVTIQTISIFRVTKESIYRSFAYGITKKDILNYLKAHSTHEVPENVEKGITTFIENLEINRLEDYKIVQINSQESYRIKEKFKNKVIEVEPHTFLVFDQDVLKNIEEFCKKENIVVKYIEDFLNGDNYFYKVHESNLIQNIRHLHTMKEFFDYYGSSIEGTKVKIDNEI